MIDEDGLFSFILNINLFQYKRSKRAHRDWKMSKLKPTTGVQQGTRLVSLQFMVYILHVSVRLSTRLASKHLKLTPISGAF